MDRNELIRVIVVVALIVGGMVVIAGMNEDVTYSPRDFTRGSSE